ncbi:hypothetical protein BH24ACI3_BH24ACI3_05580 [soil metagenome]
MSKTSNEIDVETTAFDQLEVLLESIEQHPEEAVRNHVRALAYTLLDLHHAALKRIIEIVSAQPDGERIVREFSSDELVKAVLMVHELMAQPLETRIENALEIAREQMKIYGADVELVEVKNGTARLKLFGGSQTANVSTSILKAEVEHALHEHTPDLLDVEYEDMIAPLRPVKLVQILTRSPAKGPESNEFYMPIIRADQIPDNNLRVVELAGINLLLCNVAGTIYSFQNACASGALSLTESVMDDGVLTCPCHSFRFDIRQKGRCLDDPNLGLHALAMRIENDVVKVALAKEDEINAGSAN